MVNEYTQNRINYAIETLEHALSICNDVDYHDDAKCEQSPAYVIGYSTSSMKNALIDLKAVRNDLNNDSLYSAS